MEISLLQIVFAWCSIALRTASRSCDGRKCGSETKIYRAPNGLRPRDFQGRRNALEWVFASFSSRKKRRRKSHPWYCVNAWYVAIMGWNIPRFFLPLFPHRKRGEENRIRATMYTHGRLRLMRTQYRREQAPSLRLQKNFVTVGAIHESPVIICKRIVGCDYGMERPTLVFGRPMTAPTHCQVFYRRGDSRIAHYTLPIRTDRDLSIQIHAKYFVMIAERPIGLRRMVWHLCTH